MPDETVIGHLSTPGDGVDANKAWLKPDGTWVLVEHGRLHSSVGSYRKMWDAGCVRFWLIPEREFGVQARAVVTRQQMGELLAVLKETLPKYMICELNSNGCRSVQQGTIHDPSARLRHFRPMLGYLAVEPKEDAF